MTQVIDRESLLVALRDLVREDPNTFKSLIKEADENIEKQKKERLEQIINEDFAEYDDVFRALA